MKIIRFSREFNTSEQELNFHCYAVNVLCMERGAIGAGESLFCITSCAEALPTIAQLLMIVNPGDASNLSLVKRTWKPLLDWLLLENAVSVFWKIITSTRFVDAYLTLMFYLYFYNGLHFVKDSKFFMQMLTTSDRISKCCHSLSENLPYPYCSNIFYPAGIGQTG
ncbi:hypothetical protein T4B_2118 [Trichinella pseudospiralis]|uniref:Uncharacterized protein n=1 Tax=Trichinella pseudospiralis TaxID=6337 RepID=A0A0V1ICT7_TRIPS|nr:hypothetical protein T4B_2118 [Trichinella pseudospiralis]